MSDESPAILTQTIAHLEHCLAILAEATMPSRDIAFLHTFLTHAKGYLGKDVSPDTEALENWESPENQAMIRRFITHVEEQIRLIVEEWHHAHAEDGHTVLGAKLDEMIAGLERGHPIPDGAQCEPSGLQRNGSE